MNATQQQLINSLINEFNRIEEINNTENSFNLIDINPLNHKTNIINVLKKNEVLDKKTWDKVANDEALRIVDLFKKDLPNSCVQKYGIGNSYCDMPTVLIRRDENTSTRPTCTVRIAVKVVRERNIKDSYGNYYSSGIKLKYRCECTVEEFSTIEELVQRNEFLELIRNIVL